MCRNVYNIRRRPYIDKHGNLSVVVSNNIKGLMHGTAAYFFFPVKDLADDRNNRGNCTGMRSTTYLRLLTNGDTTVSPRYVYEYYKSSPQERQIYFEISTHMSLRIR